MKSILFGVALFLNLIQLQPASASHHHHDHDNPPCNHETLDEARQRLADE